MHASRTSHKHEASPLFFFLFLFIFVFSINRGWLVGWLVSCYGQAETDFLTDLSGDSWVLHFHCIVTAAAGRLGKKYLMYSNNWLGVMERYPLSDDDDDGGGEGQAS